VAGGRRNRTQARPLKAGAARGSARLSDGPPAGRVAFSRLASE